MLDRPHQSPPRTDGAKPLQCFTNRSEQLSNDVTSPVTPATTGILQSPSNSPPPSVQSSTGSCSSSTSADSVDLSPPFTRQYITDPATGFMFQTGLGLNQRGSLCPGKNGLWSDGDPMARAWARRGVVWTHSPTENGNPRGDWGGASCQVQAEDDRVEPVNASDEDGDEGSWDGGNDEDGSEEVKPKFARLVRPARRSTDVSSVGT